MSLELEEILSLSDRVLVMFEGKIVAEFRPDVTEEELGLAMTGGRHGRTRVTSPTITTPGAPEPSGEGPRGEVREPGIALPKAGAVAIPLLTVLLAFVISGFVVFVSGKNPHTTYRAIFDGTGLNWFLPWETCYDPCARRVQPPADTDPLGAACSHGSRRRVRVPLRPLQHRRPGAVPRRSRPAILIATDSLDSLPRILHVRRRPGCEHRGWMAGIAGVLKGTVGAHEVITTIMLNWIVIWVASYLFGIGGPFQTSASDAVPSSEEVPRSGEALRLLGRSTPPGSAYRSLRRLRRPRRLLTDAQPDDSRLRGPCRRLQSRRRTYGGISVARNYFLAMAISGLFAGLAGALDVLGWQFRLDITQVQGSTIGFVGIAVALLGRNTAIGVVLAALLFAALETGTASRNLDPDVFPADLASSLATSFRDSSSSSSGRSANLVVLLALRCPTVA